MKHDDPNSKGSYTYSDAMNEWANEQDSFFRRARAGILHPSAASSGIYRVMGYAWRLLVVVLVLLVIGYVGTRRHLKSPAFSDSIAAEITDLLKAEQTKIRPFAWKSGNAMSAEFASVGSPSSFFSKLEGTYLQFERPLLSLYNPSWHLENVRIDRLTLKLRSGGIGAIPSLPATDIDDLPEFPSDFAEPDTSIDLNPDRKDEQEPLGMDLRIKSSGFGINPDFSLLTFDTLNISKLDASWGLTPLTRGRLTGATATVTREADTWTLTASTGTLRQRWLTDMQLTTPLAVAIKPGSLTFAPCELSFPKSAGTAKLSGTITTGDIPALDFDYAVTSVPISQLLAPYPKAAQLVSGKISGNGKITGSTNTSDGVSLTLKASLENGHFASIPILGALASQTGHSPLRQLPVSGTLDISTSASTTTFSNIDLVSSEDVHITGSFSVTTHDADPKPDDYPEGVPYTPAPPDYAGTVRIGLSPDLLDRATGARDKLFELESGFYWLDVPLEGRLNTLTRQFTDEVVDTFRNSK